LPKINAGAACFGKRGKSTQKGCFKVRKICSRDYCVDMKAYGPFLAEDVASVCVDNARILVKQGLAILVESS